MAATKAPARKAGPVKASTFRLGAGTPVARGAAVTAPTGGSTVDAESRAAINALISRLQALGLIA
jgi:hypothetical protein